MKSGALWRQVSPFTYFTMGLESTKPTIYSGTFERSLDAKNRVAIPAGWVSGEGEEFFVIPHPSEKYLMVMPTEEFNRTEQRIQESEATPANKRKMSRKFFGASRKVTADKQGRVLLHDEHCVEAGLKEGAVFIGTGPRFEIWAKAHHEKTSVEDEQIYQQMADAIGL